MKVKDFMKTDVISIEATDKLEYRYLLYELSRKLDLLRRQSIGATTKYLTASMIKNLGLSLPSLEEQQRISNAVGAVDCKIIAEEQRKSALEALFQSTLQQLMTGQIRLAQQETPNHESGELEPET